MKLAWQTDGQNLGYERPENKYAKIHAKNQTIANFLYARYLVKWFIQIYSALFGDTMSVSIWMGTNMMAVN